MTTEREIQQALGSPDEETRLGALQALKRSGPPVCLELVFRAMADGSWRVRKEAVELFLAADPDDAAIAGLLDLLRDPENAGLRNSAAEAAARLGGRAAGRLLILSGDPDPEIRKFSLDIMGMIRLPEFLDPLRKALDDEDVNVAAAAAEHLGSLGDSRAVPDLIDAIIRNDSVHFRFNALAALGTIGSTVAVPDAIVALADQEILRRPVYDCLGRIGDEGCAGILLAGFDAPQKSSCNAAIVAWYRIFSRVSATARSGLEHSLAGLAGSATVAGIIDSFDPDDAVLSEAVTAVLGIIGDPAGTRTLLRAYACERLSGIALTSLKRLGPAVYDALLALYQREEKPLRGAICAFIGETRYAGGIATVRSALGDDSAMVRKSAAYAAAKFAAEGFADDLAPLLEDGDFEVRAAAIYGLQRLAAVDAPAVQRIAARLEDSERAEQRRDAAVLYAALGERERLSLLVKDAAAEVRQAAVTSIGSVAVPEDRPLLLISLVDEDPDVRIAAAEAIGVSGSAEMGDALMPALGDEDPWVVCAVLRSICRIDRSRCLPAIRTLFPTADGLVMITCLELLGQLASREAVDLLETALDSTDGEIVATAVAALGHQGGEWILEHGERLLRHGSPLVRSAWAKVVAGLPPRQVRALLEPARERETDGAVRSRIDQLLEQGGL